MKTATPSKVITSTELLELLVNETKSTVCSIMYLVDDSRSKTVKGTKQVQKLVSINHVYLNHSYENKVKNLSGNTEFVAEEMKGKKRISSTIIQSLKTNEYMIDGKVLKKESATILAYFHNSKVITEAEAVAQELWTPSYYNPTPKTTMGRGTVSEEDDFGIINTYLNRIVQIKFKGIEYDIAIDYSKIK